MRLFAAPIIATLLAARGDSVAFRLCDEHGAPLHHGSIDLRSGQVDVVIWVVPYHGTLQDVPGDGSYGGRTMAGRLRGSDGTALDCRIVVEENGTGGGSCGRPQRYRVKLRELPHM